MKKGTFWFGFIVGVLGIVSHFISIPIVSSYSFWFLAAGYVAFLLGHLVKGI